MNVMQKIRIYHAALATLSILAYVTGEFGIIHNWLGYGVAIVIALRLLWALTGNPHVGLMRFYPLFEGISFTNIFTHPAITKVFMLGIAVSLLGVTATGIAMDEGKAIGLANADMISVVYADDDIDSHHEEKQSFFEEVLEEMHEFFANLLLFFVGLHISYLLVFKRPLAKFMLFLK